MVGGAYDTNPVPRGQGGAVIATGTTPEDLHARVAEDPFVVHDVVPAEVVEITPNVTDPRLALLNA